MAEPVLQLNEFFVEGGDQTASHVLLHITEPSTDEEKKKGYFFAICEITNADASYITIVQEVIDEIERGYYELPEDQNKNALELILEKINQRSPALLQGAVGLHCLVGALRQHEIIFSTCGAPTLLLFYKNRQELYRCLNLLDETPPAETSDSPQLFSQIVQGKISPNDYLFAATPRVTDYFTTDRLEKVITSRPPRQSAEHLERVLKELPDNFSFGGLIIHLAGPLTENLAPKPGRPAPQLRGASAQSLRAFFSAEAATSETLSPSIFGRVREKLRSPRFNQETTQESPPAEGAAALPDPIINAAHRRQHERALPATAPSASINWQNGIRTAGRGLATVTRVIIQLIAGGVKIIALAIWQILRAVALLFLAATNYQNRRRAILENWERDWRFYKRTVVELPLLKKVIIGGGLTLALVFGASLVYLRAAQRQKIQAVAYHETLTAIKAKTDAAESALIYKNDAAALAELTLARDLLGRLPCRTTEQKQTCQTLVGTVSGLLSRARKITIIKPELIATWPEPVERVIKLNNQLIGFSSATSSLYSYNLLTHATKIVAQNPALGGVVGGAVPKENDYALFLFKDNQFASLTATDASLKPIEISFPAENADIQSFVVYNRRLYTLDSTHNQIYKHDSTKTGFGLGKNWLRVASENLKNASDITIDGDIFASLNDGTILKFTGGAMASFTISGLDPIIKNKSRVWAYNDLTYFYVLDPAFKRLILINKDGTLKTQITAPEFAAPSGMVVDEPNKTAYLVDQGKLYKITLP